MGTVLATGLGEVFLNFDKTLVWEGVGVCADSNFCFSIHFLKIPMILDSCSVREAYEIYHQMGLPVIPVRPRTKIPRFSNWTKNYWHNMNADYIAKHPDANIGLLLGKIIDIEADSEEAEERLGLILSGIEHVQYRSMRGSHHLFLNPNKNFRKLVFDGIEYRGYGHHSLLPPSIGPNGFQYAWHKNSTTALTLLPNFLEKNIKSVPKQKVHLELPRCSKCGRTCRVEAQRFKMEIEALSLIKTKWDCHKCRLYDLRPVCRMIRSGKKFDVKDIIFKIKNPGNSLGFELNFY